MRYFSSPLLCRDLQSIAARREGGTGKLSSIRAMPAKTSPAPAICDIDKGSPRKTKASAAPKTGIRCTNWPARGSKRGDTMGPEQKADDRAEEGDVAGAEQHR